MRLGTTPSIGNEGKKRRTKNKWIENKIRGKKGGRGRLRGRGIRAVLQVHPGVSNWEWKKERKRERKRKRDTVAAEEEEDEDEDEDEDEEEEERKKERRSRIGKETSGRRQTKNFHSLSLSLSPSRHSVDQLDGCVSLPACFLLGRRRRLVLDTRFHTPAHSHRHPVLLGFTHFFLSNQLPLSRPDESFFLLTAFQIWSSW